MFGGQTWEVPGVREAYPPRRTVHRVTDDDLKFWRGLGWGVLIVAPFWALVVLLILLWVLQ